MKLWERPTILPAPWPLDLKGFPKPSGYTAVPSYIGRALRGVTYKDGSGVAVTTPEEIEDSNYNKVRQIYFDVFNRLRRLNILATGLCGKDNIYTNIIVEHVFDATGSGTEISVSWEEGDDTFGSLGLAPGWFFADDGSNAMAELENGYFNSTTNATIILNRPIDVSLNDNHVILHHEAGCPGYPAPALLPPNQEQRCHYAVETFHDFVASFKEVWPSDPRSALIDGRWYCSKMNETGAFGFEAACNNTECPFYAPLSPYYVDAYDISRFWLDRGVYMKVNALTATGSVVRQGIGGLGYLMGWVPAYYPLPVDAMSFNWSWYGHGVLKAHVADSDADGLDDYETWRQQAELYSSDQTDIFQADTSKKCSSGGADYAHRTLNDSTPSEYFEMGVGVRRVQTCSATESAGDSGPADTQVQRVIPVEIAITSMTYSGVTGNGFTAIGDAATGDLAIGNINLKDRPIVHNLDGTISTVLSTTIEVSGDYFLIPRVIDSGSGPEVVDASAAQAYYETTGEHLGKFSTEALAEAYALVLQAEQDFDYSIGQYVAARWQAHRLGESAPDHTKTLTGVISAASVADGILTLEFALGQVTYDYVAGVAPFRELSQHTFDCGGNVILGPVYTEPYGPNAYRGNRECIGDRQAGLCKGDTVTILGKKYLCLSATAYGGSTDGSANPPDATDHQYIPQFLIDNYASRDTATFLLRPDDFGLDPEALIDEAVTIQHGAVFPYYDTHRVTLTDDSDVSNWIMNHADGLIYFTAIPNANMIFKGHVFDTRYNHPVCNCLAMDNALDSVCGTAVIPLQCSASSGGALTLSQAFVTPKGWMIPRYAWDMPDDTEVNYGDPRPPINLAYSSTTANFEIGCHVTGTWSVVPTQCSYANDSPYLILSPPSYIKSDEIEEAWMDVVITEAHMYQVSCSRISGITQTPVSVDLESIAMSIEACLLTNDELDNPVITSIGTVDCGNLVKVEGNYCATVACGDLIKQTLDYPNQTIILMLTGPDSLITLDLSSQSTTELLYNGGWLTVWKSDAGGNNTESVRKTLSFQGFSVGNFYAKVTPKAGPYMHNNSSACYTPHLGVIA